MNAQNINEILDALATRFGTTGMHLWEVLVRQQVIIALYETAFFLVTAIAVTIWWGRLKKAMDDFFNAHKDNSPGYRDPDFWDHGMGIVHVILGIILGVTLVIALANVGIGFPKLLNPEYYALKELLP